MDSVARAASVLEAARGLELLSEDGTLKQLDSLNVLDMVMELERLMSIQIPTPMIEKEHFESLETVCAWLEQIAE